MKVHINEWHAVGIWKWNVKDTDSCAICQSTFETACPRCKMPGDDCTLIQGACQHFFHLHCILKWIEEGSAQTCPLCRKKWVDKKD